MNNSPSAHAERLTIGKAQLMIFPEVNSLFAAAADEFFRIVTGALKEHNEASVALSGGDTPRGLYSLIAKRASSEPELASVDWRRLHLFFGDERCVPPDDKDSNFRMVRETLLSNPTLGAARVHRILAELPPDEAAKRYEADLREYFGDGPSAFDLLLEGLGPDGHTASLFPGSAALTVRDRAVVANWAPDQRRWRITLTYPALNAARETMFLVSGAGKGQPLARVFGPKDVPAAGIQPAGPLFWMVDRAAASDLLRQRGAA